MKRSLLILVFVSSYLCLLAQPTMDFESWSGTNNEPTGWVSANELNLPPLITNPQSVFKESDPTKVHGGSYSMKIVTVKLTTNPSASTIPDPMGVAFPGQVSMSPLGIKDGFPFSTRIDLVDFYYIYAPSGNDSAACLVALTKWNNGKRDTIGAGKFSIKTASSSYNKGAINILYNPIFTNITPDTLHLVFTATCHASLTCGKAGSTLWIDDVSFSTGNKVNDLAKADGVLLYPNPVTQILNIAIDGVDATRVIIYESTGRVLASSALYPMGNSVNKKSCAIDTSTLPSGTYSYALGDKDGNIIRSGRFIVAK